MRTRRVHNKPEDYASAESLGFRHAVQPRAGTRDLRWPNERPSTEHEAIQRWPVRARELCFLSVVYQLETAGGRLPGVGVRAREVEQLATSFEHGVGHSREVDARPLLAGLDLG